MLSDSFRIFNGARQGCLLSPLICILTIESLLCRIRANVDIKGVKLGENDQKVAAFADNLFQVLILLFPIY